MNFAPLAIIVFSLAIPAAASADPGKGHGGQGAAHANGHAHQDMAGSNNGQMHGHTAMANGSWTPPGLAKKPHGMPPGQAKKVWGHGEQLPNQYYTQSRYY